MRLMIAWLSIGLSNELSTGLSIAIAASRGFDCGVLIFFVQWGCAGEIAMRWEL
jgi:hypothetical protein